MIFSGLTGNRLSSWPGTAPSNYFGLFSVQPLVVSSHAYVDRYSTEHLEGTLHKPLQFSLLAALSYSVLCLVNSIWIGFLGLSAPFPQVRISAGLCLAFPTSLVLQYENVLGAVNWAVRLLWENPISEMLYSLHS